MLLKDDCLKLLKEKVQLNEKAFVDLFSVSTDIYHQDKTFKRYYDDYLKDMYDHNFTTVDEMDDELLNKILEFKNNRNENFVKICSSTPLDNLLEKGFEKETLLTMLKSDYLNFLIPENYLINYKNARENEEVINDVIATEILYYGKEYGIDFCIRRWNRYFNKIKEAENGLNLFAVYYQNKIAGYCYSFYNNRVVCVDGLLVLEEYRKRYIASNLIKYIAHFYNCPIFLHADNEETPKEMYSKLGFETIFTSFDYLKIDK